MKTAGEVLVAQRAKKHISLDKAAQNLHIKKEHLEAIEKGNWSILPEPPFVRGFIRSYAQYLSLDAKHILALYRREFDETKYPQKTVPRLSRRLMLTPNRLLNTALIIVIVSFIAYLIFQYFSILSAPKLEVFTPSDDSTTTIPYALIQGKTEKDVTVAIDGQIIPVDENGNFSYQVKLEEGQNIIEMIASKRLSPKSKVTRTLRLTK